MSYQVNDLATLTDRQSTFSTTIKLPKTATNKAIFGQAQSDAFTQTQPYSILQATLRQYGLDVITGGNIALLRVNDNFESQLTYGLIGFLDALKKRVYDPNSLRLLSVDDVKLVDLDWSDIPNFNFDLTTIVASQNNDIPTWPVIDYGGTLVPGSSTIETIYLRPGVTFAQIFDRVQRYTGYSLLGGINWQSGFDDFIPFSATDLIDYQGTSWYTTGLPLSVVKNLPDILVKDLLKDYMNRYFLTPVVDNYRKTVTFKSFDDLYNNVSKSVDWTNKFVNDSREDSFSIGNYGQSNNLLWKKDSALNNGTGVFTVDNQNLPVSNDLLTSIFAATDNVANMAGGLTMARIIKYGFPLSTPPTIDTEIRVLKLKRATGFYAFHDNTGTMVSPAGIKYGYFNGWNYYIDNYAQGLLKLLAKCRMVTRYAILTPLDIQQLDFFIPIFDAREGKYYYLNKVSNYIPGQKVQVSLIRM